MVNSLNRSSANTRPNRIMLSYYGIREERKCDGFEQSKRWPKTREPYGMHASKYGSSVPNENAKGK